MEKSTTIPKDGKKSFEERVADGVRWRKTKLAAGWQETPDGLMPMTEVKRAGYVLNANQEWTIPAEEFIADGNSDRKAGEKYIGPSLQYLNWRRGRKIRDSNRVAIPTTRQINFKEEEEENTPHVLAQDEIDVNSIPF